MLPNVAGSGPGIGSRPSVEAANIADDFEYMDAELIEELRAKLAPYVTLPAEDSTTK